jgi:hypothetical protein
LQIIRKDPNEIDYEPFREPTAKWFRLRGAGGLPDLALMREGEDKLAQYRIVSDVGRDPLTVRYREVGSALDALYGKPLAGKTLEELYNDWFRKRAYEGYRTAMEEGFPAYVRRGISTSLLKVGYHALYLPCGTAEVTEVMTYIVPLDASIKTRDDWEKAVKESPWF